MIPPDWWLVISRSQITKSREFDWLDFNLKFRAQIEKYTAHQLEYAREAVVGGHWELFTEDGEMRMYRREMEEDGLVVDPLKAVHQVHGVTAHELAHHFWSPDVRFDWDS